MRVLLGCSDRTLERGCGWVSLTTMHRKTAGYPGGGYGGAIQGEACVCVGGGGRDLPAGQGLHVSHGSQPSPVPATVAAANPFH